MAIFRKIHVSFWKDPFIRKLTRDQKFFYLYLMTNGNTKQCGVYEIDFDTISHESGFCIKEVEAMIKFFEGAGKIMYSDKTNEIALKNWSKYNDSTSPKVKSCIAKELKDVKNRVLIQYIYSMHTLSQQEEEQEEEKEKEEDSHRQNKLFEMFTSATLGMGYNPDFLKHQVRNFLNKYPNCVAAQSGGLVNSWAARMNKDEQRKWIESSQQQTNQTNRQSRAEEFGRKLLDEVMNGKKK